MIEKRLKCCGFRAAGVASVLALVLALGTPTVATAQSKPSIANASHRFDIAAQPLPAALAAWSAASGIRVRTIPTAATALNSTAIEGEQSSIAALSALLAGTGYSFRFAELDEIVIEAIPTAGDVGASIGTVRVQGTAAVATQGVNGSTDPTATEGSSSYAADQTTVATKIPLTLKETPQSVSVVTRQQLQDRNVIDFQRALMEAPGISTVYGSSGGANNGRSNLQPTFFSRGFQIDRLQIDGGAPFNISPYDPASLVPQINMAAYDHIEILRGADGLLDGQGNPGGVVNLARKRPLDHPQLLVSQLVGSDNTFNSTVDGSAPIAFGGKLRARVVLNRQSNGYFYDTARNKQFLIYANVEAQITPSTIISGGINYQTQDAIPFQNGLIGGIANGQVIDLHLPRSTCLCFKWNRTSYDTRELFGRIEQSIVGDWKLRINGSMIRQTTAYAFGGVIGVIGSPDPEDAPRVNDSFGFNRSKQYAADISLGGSFQFLGNKQTLVFGANYSSYDGGGQELYSPIYAFSFNSPSVDVFNFNPDDYAQPDRSGSLPNQYYPINLNQNIGAYGTLRFTPVAPVHFTVGMRYNQYKSHVQSYRVCRKEFGCFDLDTFDFVDNGARFGNFDLAQSTSKFFPLGYLAASVDVTSTLSAYMSKTSIYIDNSLSVDQAGKPIGPTKGDNLEAGLKYASADHRLTASIAVFKIRQSGFPLFVGYGNSGADPVTGKLNGRNCCFTNDPDVVRKSQGVDVEVAGEILSGLQVSASYIYNKTESQTSSTVASGSPEPLESQAPRHIYKAWTRYAFQPGSALRGGYLGFGLEGQSSGSVPSFICANADFGFCSGYARYVSRLAPRIVFSAQAGYDITKQISLAVSVNNLLDKRYYTSVGLRDGGNWYGQPRNVLVSLRGAF